MAFIFGAMLIDIINKHGPSVIAEKIGESPQTVSNWRRRGVPLESCLKFCVAVDFEVTPHQLYPNHYPHPHDGLPAELRKMEAA